MHHLYLMNTVFVAGDSAIIDFGESLTWTSSTSKSSVAQPSNQTNSTNSETTTVASVSDVVEDTVDYYYNVSEKSTEDSSISPSSSSIAFEYANDPNIDTSQLKYLSPLGTLDQTIMHVKGKY